MSEKYQRYEATSLCAECQRCCLTKSGIVLPDEVKKKYGGFTFSIIRKALHDPSLPMDMVPVVSSDKNLDTGVLGLALGLAGDNYKRDGIFHVGVNDKNTEGAHCVALRSGRDGKKRCIIPIKVKPISCARVDPANCAVKFLTGKTSNNNDEFDDYIYNQWNKPQIQDLMVRVLFKETGFSSLREVGTAYTARWMAANLGVTDGSKVSTDEYARLLGLATDILERP